MSTPHTLITLVVGLLLPAIVAADVNVSGASFPERMTVDGHPLVLNGYGVRETWWINLYAVALYLPHHSADVTFIKQDDVPKAIRVEAVYDGSVPNAVPENWQDEFYPKLTPEVTARFKAAYAAIKHGDVILITYAPDRGIQVQLNGRPLLADPGPGLMTASLDLWIGAQPVSQNLRRLLLTRAS
jgi:hypothetical protein